MKRYEAPVGTGVCLIGTTCSALTLSRGRPGAWEGQLPTQSPTLAQRSIAPSRKASLACQ